MKKITRKSAKHLVERKIMRIFAHKKKKITMNNNTKNNTSDNAGVKSQWMDKLGDYLLDVSKYVLTGVVITSLFSNIKEQALIYSLGILISICSLIAGLLLTNKKKGK